MKHSTIVLLDHILKVRDGMFQNINYKPATGTGQLCRLIAEHKRDLMKRVRTRQLPPKSPIKPKTKTSTTKISIPVDKVQLQQLLQSNNTLLWNQTRHSRDASDCPEKPVNDNWQLMIIWANISISWCAVNHMSHCRKVSHTTLKQ